MNDQAVQDVAMIARKAIDRVIFLEKKMSKKPFESMVAALTTKPEIVKNPVGRKPKNPRRWQGLTDEQLETMAEKYVTNCYFDTLKFARAVEAKLREKNNG